MCGMHVCVIYIGVVFRAKIKQPRWKKQNKNDQYKLRNSTNCDIKIVHRVTQSQINANIWNDGYNPRNIMYCS